MSDYKISLTDEQEQGLTYQNNGTFPTNDAYLSKWLSSRCNEWYLQYCAMTDEQILQAVKNDLTLLSTARNSVKI